MPVACGPPGLPGGKNVLYRNHGDGTFEDVSERVRASPARSGTYGLGVSTLDFDDDGWVDVYVANDSNPSALYRNNRDGTFTDIGVDAGLRLQPGRQAAGGHGRRRRRLRPQRHGWTSSRPTSPATRRRSTPTPATASARTARSPAASASTRAGSAGASASSISISDGWLDLFLVNGHVYPEVEQLKTEAGYKQRKVVYRNLRRRPLRGRHRAARPAGDDAEGRPRRRVRRLRQRRRRRRRRQQRARHAGPVPARLRRSRALG